jgi:hypothetical protein
VLSPGEIRTFDQFSTKLPLQAKLVILVILLAGCHRPLCPPPLGFWKSSKNPKKVKNNKTPLKQIEYRHFGTQRCKKLGETRSAKRL